MSDRKAAVSERLPPRAILIALAVLVVTATAVALVLRPSADQVEDALGGGGAVGPVLFAGAYALLTIAFVPGAPLTLAAGALFGVAGGFAVTMVGAVAGAMGA
ncbi:MAG: hypothetical protein ACRDL4_15930, partial [Thermoleophilaceae bacterium]